MSRTTRPTRSSSPGAMLSRRMLVLATLAVPLAACGSQEPTVAPAPEGSTASDGGSSTGSVTITDPWVKAADEGMTAAFGTLVNGTTTDLTLVAVSTAVSPEVQLHETAADGSGGMSMTEKEGGFPLPAGDELVLEPGGHHIMLMSLIGPLQPGDEVELVLQFEDGADLPVTATVKEFAGAGEQYVPGDDHDQHREHEGHGE